MIKSRFFRGLLEFYQTGSRETVIPVAPVVLYDDFIGKAIDATSRWQTKDVSVAGNTTPLFAADAPNGILRLPLDVTSEAQESGLNMNDQRNFVLNLGLIFEARAALQTLPTLLSMAVIGMTGDYNAVQNTIAESAWFRANGDGVILVETDDTVNEQNSIVTGVTVTAGQFKTFRIDFTDIANVRFYIDGVQVAAATTFNMSQVPGLVLQPHFGIVKASGAGLGVLDVDYVRAWQNRS